ncbi:TetR/AcrR family transcriptional regulator [Microbacterium sp. C23T]
MTDDTQPLEPTRRERKRERGQLDIVDAAFDILSRGGSAALTLQAIADEADVAVQTIYNRVGNRAAILMALADRAFEVNRAYMEPAYASLGESIDDLIRVAEAYARFAVEHPNEFRFLAEPPESDAVAAAVTAAVAEQNTRLESALRSASDRGIATALDPAATSEVLWAAMNGVLLLAIRRRLDDSALQRLVSTFVTIVRDGLAR